MRAEVPELRTVHTHIEPLARHRLGEHAADHATPPPSARRSSRPCSASPGSDPLDVTFRDGEQGRVALVTVGLPGEQPLPSAHQHAGAIEEAVRERCPGLADVIVHTEPIEAEAP